MVLGFYTYRQLTPVIATVGAGRRRPVTAPGKWSDPTNPQLTTRAICEGNHRAGVI